MGHRGRESRSEGGHEDDSTPDEHLALHREEHIRL